MRPGRDGAGGAGGRLPRVSRPGLGRGRRRPGRGPPELEPCGGSLGPAVPEAPVLPPGPARGRLGRSLCGGAGPGLPASRLPGRCRRSGARSVPGRAPGGPAGRLVPPAASAASRAGLPALGRCGAAGAGGPRPARGRRCGSSRPSRLGGPSSAFRAETRRCPRRAVPLSPAGFPLGFSLEISQLKVKAFQQDARLA